MDGTARLATMPAPAAPEGERDRIGILDMGSGICRKVTIMCIDPNAEPVAFALDTKLCHLLPTLTEPHREAIAQYPRAPPSSWRPQWRPTWRRTR
ncbi:hypothetical protein ACM61V_19575 [Sphingomonas sp. TX0543]|uniref:hypothetical protein n=1 Tax=Sphingomonas sp. TX0543 TaxID=3399682 RepID=UPI003AFA028A